jgi:hypothetical protein
MPAGLAAGAPGQLPGSTGASAAVPGASLQRRSETPSSARESGSAPSPRLRRLLMPMTRPQGPSEARVQSPTSPRGRRRTNRRSKVLQQYCAQASTVLKYCARVLCSSTVLKYCAQVLCSSTVLKCCAQVLCSSTMFKYCAQAVGSLL